MDLDRGIVKALFYDYPVDEVVRLLDKHRSMQQDVYLDILPQLMQWAKPEYTYTEANLLRIQTGGDWKNELSTLYHPFDKLTTITDILLDIEKEKPTVRFEQLFRWKESALYVGEDLLVTAFLAYYDLQHPTAPREMFTWGDILPHNNHNLNDALNKGLSDLHAHYNATVDVFKMNWLCLMNNLAQRKQFDTKLQRSQELELMGPRIEKPSTIKQHCIAAAYLRFVFYNLLLNSHGYGNKQFDDLIENRYQSKVQRILTDKWYAEMFAEELQNSISYMLLSSVQTADNRHIDYCLHISKEMKRRLVGNDTAKIGLIYQGERELLYSFFHGYYSHDPKCVCLAPYFYLYVLLKSKIRREFVQINVIKGFENFETYQDRKDILLPDNSPLKKYYAYIVANSSSHTKSDLLEVRVTPKSNMSDKKYACKPIFKMCEEVNKQDDLQIKSPLSIVVHFIKKGKYTYNFPTLFNTVGKVLDGTRDEKYRHKIHKEIKYILQYRKHSKLFCGIDAASSEIFCRPETFGHIYRYALANGIQGRTYHVGEDFLDLVDGLRAVDEAVLFLQLDDKCRIGHAMALGIDACAYYTRRHFSTVITKQYLLDDCVWLLMRSKELNVKISDSLERELNDKASTLADQIGYGKCWNKETYWYSMLLRGNDPQYIGLQAKHPNLDLWDKTANLKDCRLETAYANDTANQLFRDYFYDCAIKQNGLILEQYKWNKEIVSVVCEIQKKMRNLVSEKKIGIECCPTSNLKIGFIDRYDQHPLLTKFYPIDADASYPLIKCSINTDDRGVFYTSIYEEYSLIALALYKQKKEGTNEPKYNEREIMRYIREIRKNAELMAFSRYLEK